jgi:hypothetical protein
VKSKKVWKNKKSVEELDYSILLAHVFGKPITTEQAFMYFFRRYGLPNERHDDYKGLCCYSFRTRDRSIIVRWHMMTGDYHHGLCAFSNYKDWAEYAVKPDMEWRKALQEKAEKDGKVFLGDNLFYLHKRLKNGKYVFKGNDIQRKAIDNFLKDYTSEDKDVWEKLYDWACDNDKAISNAYRDLLPYPEIESQYGKSWGCQFNRQVEAGKEQHEWIMSLPEAHFLRRVYFTVMELFEDWKRKTYIRDVYFDLTCEEDPNANGETTEYTDYSIALNGRENV